MITLRWMNTKTRQDTHAAYGAPKHLHKRRSYEPTDRQTDERLDPIKELLRSTKKFPSSYDFMRHHCWRKGWLFADIFAQLHATSPAVCTPSLCECRVLGVQINTGEFLRDRVNFLSFLQKKCREMILSSLCPSSDAHLLQNGYVTLSLSNLLSTYV